MRILLCHNFYQQPGGEDQSFDDETRLLKSRGNDVTCFSLHNDSVSNMSRVSVAARTFWNQSTFHDLRTIIRRERPEVMHCTNTFPLISPSAYYAARAENVAVVQSLRNYRLLCPNGLFLREGRICEKCLGKAVAWPSVVHGCYRQSRAGTAVVAGMLATHRLIKTWKRAVHLYFTPSEFARQKFIEGGFPARRIAVKANFVSPDPGIGPGRGGYAVFVGRLSPEKGLDTLLDAWSRLRKHVHLKVIGDGPLAQDVRLAADRSARIEWLGRRGHDEALSIIGDAAVLVMPSIAYETFGRTVVEAFAKGTPVITTRGGAMAELVQDGATGLHFSAGDADDLASKVQQLLADPLRLEQMRDNARDQYERKYTAGPNYAQLMAIYNEAIALNEQHAGWSEASEEFAVKIGG